MSLSSYTQSSSEPLASRTNAIPQAILEQGLLSDTSSAGECFVNQRFSAKLQAFMIGYVASIVVNRSIYEA